jgi:hypothetical protein
MATAVLATACSGSAPEKGPGNKRDRPYSTYSIKLFAGSGASRQLVKVPPVPVDQLQIPLESLLKHPLKPDFPSGFATTKDDVGTAPAGDATGSGSGGNPPRHTADIQTPDGGSSLPSSDLNKAAGWALVYGAFSIGPGTTSQSGYYVV